MPLERLDQVALDDRAVGADDPPGHDVRVRAGLVDQPGDEGAVSGQRVDAAVERAHLVEPLLGVGLVVDVADADRRRVDLDVALDHAVQPRVLAAPGVQGRHHGAATDDLVVRLRRRGAGPTYVIGWRRRCRRPVG